MVFSPDTQPPRQGSKLSFEALHLVVVAGISPVLLLWLVSNYLTQMKRVNEVFTDSEFEALLNVKGDRTWHQAIKEEFGIDE